MRGKKKKRKGKPEFILHLIGWFAAVLEIDF